MCGKEDFEKKKEMVKIQIKLNQINNIKIK